MSFPLTWLQDVLNDAGLKVAPPEPGWETRGRSGIFGAVRGVICHHTAGPKTGNIQLRHGQEWSPRYPRQYC